MIRIIPNNLRKLRLERHMTQYQVAIKLGVMLATYSSWENEKRNIPIGRAQEIAEIFDIDWKEIFE